ncbi:MAG: gamma-glutamyl-gamma-aminobutyrate hydrolase family protein [Burkholderiales bacterium]|jgi:putative glutamine amidotransferase|nr:gamma-glutamyl-gamma-aminobutyrate hydrolase family protein [Betaproteobacteria bacterium]
MNSVSPIVGVPCCTKFIGEHDFHVVGGKYIRALTDIAGCAPVLIPALGASLDVARMLNMVDGLLLTGSVSNIEPARYGKSLLDDTLPHDVARDETNLTLVQEAIRLRVPVFGICRGFQELNVAMGGSLHQAVHGLSEMQDHRGAEGQPAEIQYGPAHVVQLAPGGKLQSIFLGVEQITVNSVHGQGIDQLGEQLDVEATAPDGLIEAIRVRGKDRFALAVQWHPEWRASENQESRLLFSAFGDACRQYRQSRVS